MAAAPAGRTTRTMKALLNEPSRTNVSQVFLLVGPLASRIAASLPQSAVLERANNGTRILIDDKSAGRFGRGAAASLLENLTSFSQHLMHQQQDAAATFEQTSLLLNESSSQTSATDIIYNNQQQHQLMSDHGHSLASTLSKLSAWELLLVSLLISLILISIVGNCLVCIAIFTDRRLRKLGNAFIVSLAIADLFVSCLVMTFALCNDLMDYWMFGEWFCDIWISFDIMCCTASILNLCAISLDRFIHIKDCLLYNQLMTRRVAISAVIGIWIISALVSFVPINLGWHKPDHFKSSPAAGALLLMNSQHDQHHRQQQQQQPPFFTRNDNLMLEQNASLAGRAPRLRRRAQTSFANAASEMNSETGNNNQEEEDEDEELELEREAKGAEWRQQTRTGETKQSAHFDNTLAQLNRSGLQKAPPPPPPPPPKRAPTGNGQHAESANDQRRRSVNKDFVPTTAKRAETRFSKPDRSHGAGSSAQLSSGSSGHAPNWRAQVDSMAEKARQRANYNNSDKLASEPSKQCDAENDDREHHDDRMEFNTRQDGPPKLGQGIKAQPLARERRQTGARSGKKRPSPGARDIVAQTEPGPAEPAQAALLDHHDDGGGNDAADDGRTLSGGQLERQQPDGAAQAAQAAQAAAALSGAGEPRQLAQCMLTLTPTYAIISSTISFYIPCLIMLGLYSRLFACARRHVRNIRAITRVPNPIGTSCSSALATNLQHQRPICVGGGTGGEQSNNLASRTSSSLKSTNMSLNETSGGATDCPRPALTRRARTWIKFGKRRADTSATRTAALASAAQSASGAGGGSDDASRSVLEQQAGLRSALAGSARKASQIASCEANDKTIGQTGSVSQLNWRAREDEPFLERAANESEPAAAAAATGANDPNNCDNANDAPVTRRAQATTGGEHKILTNFNATTIKLNLAPGELATAAAAAAPASMSSKIQIQQQQQHKQQQTSQLATHKAAITLGIIMGTFLFCWVPFFCLNIIKAFYVDSIPGSMFRAFTWLGYANSALNPIIYGIHNSEFRHAFNRIFFKHLTLKNGRQYLNRRFSYDLRQHHQHTAQAQPQAQPQPAAPTQPRPHHATTTNTNHANNDGGNKIATTNHQQGRQVPMVGGIRRHAAGQTNKRRASAQRSSVAQILTVDEARPLVNHEQHEQAAERPQLKQSQPSKQSRPHEHRPQQQVLSIDERRGL